MIPSYPSPQNQLDLTQVVPEGQPMQIPKIDHIIAHAKHPEFSYIYARPELQASASSTIPQPSTPSQNDASTPKKGRPKKTAVEGGEKNAVTKVKKSQIYDKYYIDTTKPKKTAPLKKVDLWDKDAWHAILNRKKKYFEFCKLTGELTNWRSDDEEGEADDISEDEEDLENLRRIPRDNYKEDFREQDDNENENENNDGQSKEGEMQVEDDNKDNEQEQSESGQDNEERESVRSNENKGEIARDVQGNAAEVEHSGLAGVEEGEQREGNVEKMQVEDEHENPEEKGEQNTEMQNNQENL